MRLVQVPFRRTIELCKTFVRIPWNWSRLGVPRGTARRHVKVYKSVGLIAVKKASALRVEMPGLRAAYLARPPPALARPVPFALSRGPSFPLAPSGRATVRVRVSSEEFTNSSSVATTWDPREVISRVLRNLARSGAIRLSLGSVAIVDADKLRRAVE